jgi:drug/metabolite transporter (DMT)-like permease
VIGTQATRVALAQAAVWLIWGSTYYGVRVLVQTVPPFFGMGSRFFVAGLAVLLFLRLRGTALPRAGEWAGATIGGVMMVAVGNGAVAYTEQTVPSNLVALTVALMPLWMVMFDRLINGVSPPRVTLLGIALGFVGVAVLLGPSDVAEAADITLIGAATVMAGSMSWGLGSVLTRRMARPTSVMMGTAAQMIWGGLALMILSGGVGEWGRLSTALLTQKNVVVWLYLVVAGSVIAYSAYVYLLHHTTPARAGSYAFVNPVIAVVIGSGLGGEPLNSRVGIAAVLIVSAVAVIVSHRQ